MLITTIQQEQTPPTNWNLRSILERQIKNKGGWVNAHSHIDRAFTISSENFNLTDATLHQKWQLVDECKQSSTVHQIYDRMCQTIELMLSQGVSALGTFLDADSKVENKAIKAAQKIRSKYKKDLTIKFISHTSKGVIKKEEQPFFEELVEFADIIGGLPAIDKGKEEQHLDILFKKAKKTGKMLHVHVDQLNISLEKETEQLVNKTKEFGMQNRVVAVHGISIAAHNKQYRQSLYKKMKEAGVMLVCCPTAWIDSRRSEELAPSHNSIAPVDELIPEEIVVALGTDNIADIYKPFSDGDMWTELRVLLESCHYYDIEQLANIATTNGRKALGLEITPFFLRRQEIKQVSPV